MMIYIVMLMFTIFSSSIVRFSKSAYLFFSIGLIFVVVGWRALTIGSDTPVYVSLFNRTSSTGPILNHGDSILNSRFEIGFLYFNRILAHITSNPRILLVCSSFVVCIFLYFFLKKYSTNIVVSIVLFITMGFMAQSMNIMRQAMAIAVLMLAFKYLVNDKTTKFILTVFVAFLFHKAAILFMILLFFKHVTVTKKMLVFILVITLALMTYLSQIMNIFVSLMPTYDYYEGTTFDTSLKWGTFFNILVLIVFLFIGLYAKKNTTEKLFLENFSNKTWNILQMMLILNIVILILSTKFAVLDRMALDFSMAYLIYVGNAINMINKPWVRLIMNIGVIILSISYFVIILIYRPNWTTITPYIFN
ncbi:EpsG family protein [Dellaglioa sp. L3N]